MIDSTYSISHFVSAGMRGAFALVAVLVSAAVPAACSDAKVQPVRKFDLAADAMPFVAPVAAPQASLSGMAALPRQAQERLHLRRAFFAGDFQRVEAAMNDAHEKLLAGQSGVPAATLDESLAETQLAGVDRCVQWLQAMPKSYAAHYLCGAIWHAGARAARTHKFANEVSPARFALMRERLDRSNELLTRALALTPKPLEALVALGDNHLLGGRRGEGEAYLARAEAILPGHAPIHYTRIVFAMPEWGGSTEQVRAVLTRAGKAGVADEHLLAMEDEYVVRPWHMSTPGAGRAYWERAIAQRPLKSRLLDLSRHLVYLQNWQDALPVATRLIDAYPDTAEGHYLRARINEGLGRNPQAWGDYRMAAALGHDHSLQTLIQTHIRGGIGLPGKAFAELDEVCRHGAALGSPVGTNCLGGLHFEGRRGGGPYEADPAQALAWYLMSARGGHFNSQHDLGWLMFTSRAPGLEPQQARKAGVFWLRRAAEQGHEFAKRKLAENRIEPSESVERVEPDAGAESTPASLMRAIYFWLASRF